jgi:hypothetical protein
MCHINLNATKQQQINLCISYEESGIDIKIQKTIHMHRKTLLPKYHDSHIAMTFLYGTVSWYQLHSNFNDSLFQDRDFNICRLQMSESSLDLLRCGICMEPFNQDDRKPKFLQCYHTYCCKCLIQIQEKVTIFYAVYLYTSSLFYDRIFSSIVSYWASVCLLNISFTLIWR